MASERTTRGERTPAGGGRDLLGGAAIATAAVLFGAVVILGKTLPRSLPVTSMLAVRFGIAAVVLAAVLSILRRSLRPERGEAWRLTVLGSAGYGTESTFFFLALGRGTAAAVTLLFFTYPVWVTTISALLGRGLPGWVVGGALAAAVAGAALVVASGGGLDIAPAGIAFALGSSLTFALYLLGAETWASRTSPLVSAMWVSGSASVALALFSVLGGAERFPQGGDEWIRVASMGFLTAGAFGLLFVGLRRVGAVRTAIIAALEPVVASLMAALILHEPLRPGVVAGGILILVAAVTASVVRGRETGAVP